MIQKLCPRCRKVYIPAGLKACQPCAALLAQELQARAHARQKRYDQNTRNREADAFYHSTEWKALRAYKLNKDCICEVCHDRPAVLPHHIVPVREDWSKRLDINNLLSVCERCHATFHPKGRKADAEKERTD